MLPHDPTKCLDLPYFNEAVAALHLGVVADEELLDAGCIVGTGFAPFRGGPMNYVCETCPNKLRERLAKLAERHGKRFEPDEGWHKLL